MAVIRVDGARLEVGTASRFTPSQLPLAIATLSRKALGDPDINIGSDELCKLAE